MRTYAVTHSVDLKRQFKEKQMGRPLTKDINGADVRGIYTGANAGVRLEFYDGSTLQTDGIVVKQRGAKTFVVARVGTPTTTTTAVLKNGAPSAAGEMRLFGYNTSNSGAVVNIAKITKRVATDFSGNRYTWVLANDSSNDYIVLTPIA
jgi:ribosomal protein L27